MRESLLLEAYGLTEDAFMARLHEGGQALRSARERLIARAQGAPLVCGRCGERIDRRLPGTHPLGLTVGHVVAVADGGTDHDDNLRPEHNTCNRAGGTSRGTAVAFIARPPVFPGTDSPPRRDAARGTVPGSGDLRDRASVSRETRSRSCPSCSSRLVPAPLDGWDCPGCGEWWA